MLEAGQQFAERYNMTGRNNELKKRMTTMATCKAWNKPAAPPPSPPTNKLGLPLLNQKQNEQKKKPKKA